MSVLPPRTNPFISTLAKGGAPPRTIEIRDNLSFSRLYLITIVNMMYGKNHTGSMNINTAIDESHFIQSIVC
jgi:hypothetical protein